MCQIWVKKEERMKENNRCLTFKTGRIMKEGKSWSRCLGKRKNTVLGGWVWFSVGWVVSWDVICFCVCMLFQEPPQSLPPCLFWYVCQTATPFQLFSSERKKNVSIKTFSNNPPLTSNTCQNKGKPQTPRPWQARAQLSWTRDICFRNI